MAGAGRFAALMLAGLLGILLASAPLQQARAEGVIRDAEIEAYLKEITTPIFAAAGLGDQHVSIILIDSPMLNAFVSGGQNIFLYTGLLATCDNPGELYGVIAHETGHIAGGHLARGAAAARQASSQALIGTLLGVAAGVASGNPGAGVALITGGSDVAMRSFLAFSRQQESAADNAGLSFMQKAKLDPRGLVSFLEKLESQELLPPERQSQFVRTHPLTRDRVDALRSRVEQSNVPYDPISPQWIEDHARMRAKLMGFTDPMQALQTYGAKDTGFAAQYGRAIALFKRNQLAAALPIVDVLLKREPKNPYLFELKGQMLFESAQVKDSIPLYKQALALVPRVPVIQTEYAHALIEGGSAADLPEAITNLQDAVSLEEGSPLAWRLLATAWGRQGHEGLSSYALAESAANAGDVKLARLQVARAERLLPAGSPELLKLIDLKGTLDQLEEAPKAALMSGMAGMISVWPRAKATVLRLRMRRVRCGAARCCSCIHHKLQQCC